MGSADHFEMTIGGQAVGARDSRTIFNPFDRTPVGTHPMATLQDLNSAVAAARRAFPGWAALSDGERQTKCMEIARMFEAHAEELARLVTLEQGKPLDANGLGSRFELAGCSGWSMAAAQLALPDTDLPAPAGVRAVQKRVPKGVVGSITPWNWPLLIAVWHFLPALRAGNCVVVKPSPFTPLSTLRAVALLNTILPPGVLNIVTGGVDIGRALASHPGIDKIIFTGSTATGRQVMTSAASILADCSLELGGNDAALILPDADISAIAAGVFAGAFINAGQTCGAIKRLYVARKQHDDLVEALADLAQQTVVGNGLDPATTMGPLQNEAQYEKVSQLIADAESNGARKAAGGQSVGTGYGLRPAILANCQQGMKLVREEQFGPALPVLPYDSIDEAIRLANDSEYGLGASVWGGDSEEIDRAAAALEAGTIYVNTHAELHPMIPFSGVKNSGIGVQFGEDGLRSFTDSKVVYHRAA